MKKNNCNDRLLPSFKVLKPRMQQLATCFADRIERANPRLRLMFPSDTRTIAASLTAFLEAISSGEDHGEQGETMTYELAHAGAERGMTEDQLPLVQAALEDSMAEIAGYTWTPALARAWASQFESLTPCATEALRSIQIHAA